MLQRIREFERVGYVVKCGTAERQLLSGVPMPCTVVVAFKKPKDMVPAFPMKYGWRSACTFVRTEVSLRRAPRAHR